MHGVTVKCYLTYLNDSLISIPHTQLSVRSRQQWSSKQIQPQRPGRFSNASQRVPIDRWVKKKEKKKKLTLNIPLSMVKILITLWMVYQCTQSHYKETGVFLTQLLERKETTQWFHHEANGDFTTVAEFNSCDRRKRRMDQQHCSYSTIT